MQTFIFLWIALSTLVGYIAQLREGKFLPAFISSLILSPLLSGILTVLMPFRELTEEEIAKKIKRVDISPGIKIGVIAVTFLLLTVPFHFIPSYYKIMTKENFTFNNTLIFSDDIQKITDRYNNASFIEKTKIMDEPLYKKLSEENIIFVQDQSPKE